MTVIVLSDRQREVAVPGTSTSTGCHECEPGSCTTSHYFGNIFICRSTGCHHVCDRTCRYRQYAQGGTICRLTNRFFAWEEQSVLGKCQRDQELETTRGFKKRSRDDIENDMCMG